MDLFLGDRHDLAFISGSPVVKLYVSFAPFLAAIEQAVAGDAGRVAEYEFGKGPIAGIRLLADLRFQRRQEEQLMVCRCLGGIIQFTLPYQIFDAAADFEITGDIVIYQEKRWDWPLGK